MAINHQLGCFMLIAWFAFPGNPAAQTQASPKGNTAFDLLYESGGLMEVNLIIDLDQVIANRKNEDKVEGIFSFTDRTGMLHSWTANVNVRGRFRRMRCDFPPLKVDLSKKELKKTGLDKHDEFKLVTHCQNESIGEALVIREYLVYCIYNLLTEKSFRAQLSRVNYHNTRDNKVLSRYGILIEDDKELADRLNATICEGCYSPKPDTLDPEMICLQDLFQLMIGNTDWNNQMMTNIALLIPKDGGQGYIVPYDFDFSGFVNANYAVPKKDHGIANVRERIYLGFPHSQEVLEKTIAYFQTKEPEILQLIEESPYPDKGSKKDMQKYIRSFFKQLEKLDAEEAENLSEYLANWKN